MNDIVVRGKVTISQGDRVLVKDALNHFVDDGLAGLIGLIICDGVYNNANATGIRLWNYGGTTGMRMYLGSNTTTATTTGMTALTTPIGTAPGTDSDSRSVSVKDGSNGGDNDGVFRAIYHATWNAGTVSGTLGELALYLWSPDNKATFSWGAELTNTIDLEMVSRLSAADTDFSSFTINTAVPLTVDWTVEFAFA